MLGLCAGLLLAGNPAGAQVRHMVVVNGDRVSLSAQQAHVQDLVVDIAQQSNTRIVQHAPLTRRVTLDIERRPIVDVLALLLNGNSYQLLLTPAGSNDVLWIFSDGESPASPATSFHRTMNLGDADPDLHTRLSAVELYTELEGDQGVIALVAALTDTDPTVRLHAVDALEEIGSNTAYQTLLNAQYDEDPDVRDAVTESLALLRHTIQ